MRKNIESNIKRERERDQKFKLIKEIINKVINQSLKVSSNRETFGQPTTATNKDVRFLNI